MLTLTCFKCERRRESDLLEDTYLAPCCRCAVFSTVRIVHEEPRPWWSRVSSWSMLAFAAVFLAGMGLWIYSLACDVLDVLSLPRDR